MPFFVCIEYIDSFSYSVVLEMYSPNTTVWYPFCLLWSSITCFRPENVSYKCPILQVVKSQPHLDYIQRITWSCLILRDDIIVSQRLPQPYQSGHAIGIAVNKPIIAFIKLPFNMAACGSYDFKCDFSTGVREEIHSQHLRKAHLVCCYSCIHGNPWT